MVEDESGEGGGGVDAAEGGWSLWKQLVQLE